MIVEMLKLYLQLLRNVQMKLQFILAPQFTDFLSLFTPTPLIKFEKHYLQLKLLSKIFNIGMDNLSFFPIFSTEKLPSRLRLILQVSTVTQVIYVSNQNVSVKVEKYFTAFHWNTSYL